MSPDHWDVYRDEDGNPVTITDEQSRAIWHAISVWQAVCMKEKGKLPDTGNLANLSKSCLLGRMLFDGRPPLPEAPPVAMAAPQYHLTDPDLCPTCGRARDGEGGPLEWQYEDGVPVREVRCALSWHRASRGRPRKARRAS